MEKSALDELLDELRELADRANVAFTAGQYALVDELLARAKQIAKQIDPDLVINRH